MKYAQPLFFLIFSWMHTAKAQEISVLQEDTSALFQPIRIEFERDIETLNFTTINGGEDGLMVVKQTSNDDEGNGFEWVIYQLDTMLQIQWEHHFRVPFVYNYRGWEYSDGNYFLLFSTALFSNDSYVIYYLDTEYKQVRSYEVFTGVSVKLSHFEVIGETAIMAGNANANPVVITFNIIDPKPKVVPGIYNSKSELLNLHTDDEAQRFSVTIREKLHDRKHTVKVKTFNLENRELYSNRVAPLAERNIIDGATTQFEAGYQYIAGGYSSNSTQFSEGLYLSKFVDGQQIFISYYNFSDLLNFFKYLRPKKEKKVQNKIQKKRDRGKRSKFPYQLVVHDIVEQNNQFFLIGEAYYNGYESYMTRDQESGMKTIQATIPGFKFSHVTVVAFDTNGQIKWDISFSLNDMFKEYLSENVVVLAQGSELNLHFIENNEIRSKTVKAEKLLEKEMVTPVRLFSADEEIGTGETVEEGIVSWYGETMYAYGEQDIVKKDDGIVRKNREVYYINKVLLLR